MTYRPTGVILVDKAAADKPLPPHIILLYSLLLRGLYTEFGIVSTKDKRFIIILLMTNKHSNSALSMNLSDPPVRFQKHVPNIVKNKCQRAAKYLLLAGILVITQY